MLLNIPLLVTTTLRNSCSSIVLVSSWVVLEGGPKGMKSFTVRMFCQIYLFALKQMLVPNNSCWVRIFWVLTHFWFNT